MNYSVMISLIACWVIFVVSASVSMGIMLSNNKYSRPPVLEMLWLAFEFGLKLVLVIGGGIFAVLGFAWLIC